MKEKRKQKQPKKNVKEPIDEEALFYSPKNIERLRRAAAALDAGKGVEHDIIEVDDDIPNAETMAAIKEVEALKTNPNTMASGSFEELLEELKDLDE